MEGVAKLRQVYNPPIIKGWKGELKTKFISWLFLNKEYQVFDNIIISTSRGSTQIDHIAVSKYGVFVIETKDKTGWIFGGSNQEQWTQVIFDTKYKFQNPLRQNYGHTKSLSEFLKIDHSKIHSLIIFWEIVNSRPQCLIMCLKAAFLTMISEVISKARTQLYYQQKK